MLFGMKSIQNWRMKMIEFFEARDPENPGNLHYLVKLTKEFIDDVKQNEEARTSLVEMFREEVDRWANEQ